jgi:hypothetical protein
MKALYYLCALLVFGTLLSQGQDFRPLNTSPAFIWGNANYLFSGQNKQVLDVVSSTDIKNALLRNKINTVLSSHFIGGNSQQPEVFFIFVEDQLRSDQVSVLGDSLHNLKSLIQTSSSSMAIPYVYTTENSIGNEIVTGLAEVANKVVVATNGDSSVLPASMRRNVITLDKLLSLSSDNSWELLNNNQLDVVVVLFDSHSENNNLPTMDSKMVDGIAADDAFIGKLLANIENKGVKYSALFTAQQPATQVQYFLPSSDPKMARFELAAEQVQDDPNSCDGCLWPNNVQEGLIVIAPFIIILIIGVTCNFQIQSELKYDAEKPKKF